KVEPIAKDRYLLRACVGQASLDKLHRAQALLNHKIPNGDLPAVLDRILDLAIQQKKKKFGASSKHRTSTKPSNNPRHVPERIKHTIWHRDGGQCTFVSESGHRLRFDHVVPVARGGQATVENIRLRCRAHNVYAAEQALSAEFMRRRMSGSMTKAGQCFGRAGDVSRPASAQRPF